VTTETAQPVPTEPTAPFLPSQWQEPTPVLAAPEAGATGTGLEAVRRPDSSNGVPVWGPVVNPSGDVPPTAVSDDGRGHRGPGWLWSVVAVAAALVGGLIGGGIVAATTHNDNGATVKEISAGPALLNGVTNIETVIGKVLPAIVSIDAKGPAPASQSIFGGSGAVQEDQGTGMIITSNGEVVTNNHVIAGATTITVTLYGSLKALPATLVDTDPTNDVALLQINNQSNLPTVTYGNSDNVQVGDGVVAIGNALGLSAGTPTVTQGIISAKGRSVQASDSSGNSTENLTNMFQTDAAINPGNSGGPLVDSSGRVIGMNTAVASSADGTSQAQNIGFAIPSNKIGKLLPALRSKSINSQQPSGTAFLGVSLETLTSQLRSEYNFKPTQGAVVLQVQSGSPADTAGMQQGDVITAFQGKAVTSADQLATAIQADKPGQTVKIGLYRGQDQMTVTATLESSTAAASNG
jgi:putative serine protease PepD